MNSTVIEVQGLGKQYRIGPNQVQRNLRETITDMVKAPFEQVSGARANKNGDTDRIWALRDVSFSVERGEVLGIIGRNGAGKSTLLKILSRITKPTEGYARIRGRVGSLLEVGTGFHPELTGRENVYLSGAILGMTRVEIERKFDEIVAFSEVEQFLDTPVKHYSSGMYLRLAFAVAAHLEPEILIVDEVLAVGDAEFQRKCLGKMKNVASEGRTVLFVSHNMSAVQRLCSRVLLLNQGRITAEGTPIAMVQHYLDSSMQESGPNQWIDVSALDRIGTGQVRVTAIKYSSDQKELDFRPHTYSPLTITLSLISDAARSIGSLAVTLYDRNGVKLVNADTLSLAQRMDLERGENQVQLRLENLYLNSGTYTLGWWIGNPPRVYDYVDFGLSLEVFAKEAGLGVRAKEDGVVPGKFEVNRIN